MTKECFLMEIEKRARVAVFASGTGTNFEAMMADDNREFEPEVLVCDKPKAHVIGKAAHYGVETLVLTPGSFPSKADYEIQIISNLERLIVELIVHDSYMQIVFETLFESYIIRIVNVPSFLLSPFPRKDVVEQAIYAGVKVSGLTIHFVDEGVDTGPIIA